MKTIQLEIPDGKRAEWVNGVLTLVDDKPIEYKFKVGDKVKTTIDDTPLIFAITGQYVADGEPWYELSDGWGKRTQPEKWLELVPQDITERIKTLANAVEWCRANGKDELVDAWYNNDFDGDEKDIDAYLKLRIITAALNEGWEPTYEMGETGELVEAIFVPDFGDEEVPVIRSTSVYGDSSAKLCFKSHELAIYAAKQFKDIYADFCGCKKGGEE